MLIASTSLGFRASQPVCAWNPWLIFKSESVADLIGMRVNKLLFSCYVSILQGRTSLMQITKYLPEQAPMPVLIRY